MNPTPVYCQDHPICGCKANGCEYHTDKQGEIKQRVADYYDALYDDKPLNKKPKRKHATNYTPSKRRHRK